MTNLVKFANAGLPVTAASVASMAAALRKTAAEVGLPGGAAILKMDKTGTWVFGADQTEVQEGSQWAVNPLSFTHGFIAWGEGEVLGEKMVPVQAPLPELDAAPAGSKRGWEMQIGLSLQCLNGEDEGLDVRFATTSVGGKRAVQELAVAIAEQVEKDQSTPVPVVELLNESYKHKQYGKVYTPIFDVKRWIRMDGEGVGAQEPEKAKPAAAAPAKRAPVAAAPAPAAEPVDNDEQVLQAMEQGQPAAAAAAEEAPRRRRRVVA
jgi:hypothetical protein